MSAGRIDAAGYGRVAVLCGGESTEREISLKSGAAVLAALEARGVAAFQVDGLDELLAVLAAGRVDRVFNIMHGGAGENGVVQGLLAAYRIPCTGSPLSGAALTMDKIRCKQLWRGIGLPTPDYCAVNAAEPDPAGRVRAALDLPLIVKPAHEGSTIGTHRVTRDDELAPALAVAFSHDRDVVVETLIVGEDVTVAILDDTALPSIRIRPAGDLYDYNAKYEATDTIFDCPGLTGDEERRAGELARAAFRAAGAGGWGRVDLMRDLQGALWLLEVNTTPGMTDHSLVPMAARAAGIDFEELTWRILSTSR
mgnify:CR=1 FL=1